MGSWSERGYVQVELNPAELSAELMARSRDVQDADDRVQAAAATLVELGLADAVSITERVDATQFRTRAATDERAAAADASQFEMREGPYIDEVFQQGILAANDLRDDPRWPHWGPLVAEIGLRGLISVQLYASGTTLGALNLFSTEPQNFSSDDVEKARAVATIVSIELARSRHDAHLWKAVDARHRVGQAQGILMHQFRFGSDEAWALLLRLSQQGNTKLFVIADRIIAAGELPRKLAAPEE